METHLNRSVFLPSFPTNIMSATLSGIIVLENASTVDGLPSTIQFQGQMWLGEGRVLIGKYRYYNTYNLSFDDVGQYFAWIHVMYLIPKPSPLLTFAQVAKFTPVPTTVTEASVPQVLPSESQSGEESHVTETLASEHSDEIEDFEDFHVVGDIIYVCPFLSFRLPLCAHTPFLYYVCS